MQYIYCMLCICCTYNRDIWLIALSPAYLSFHLLLWSSRPFLWGEAGRKVEAQRCKVGWLQWTAPGTREVLDSLDCHRMRQSLEHFPQNAPLEVSLNVIAEPVSLNTPCLFVCILGFACMCTLIFICMISNKQFMLCKQCASLREYAAHWGEMLSNFQPISCTFFD